MTIVKVQIPIFANHANPLCLVYPQGRSPFAEQDITQATRDALNGDLKGYFEAELKNGEWVIGDRVKDQPW